MSRGRNPSKLLSSLVATLVFLSFVSVETHSSGAAKSVTQKQCTVANQRSLALRSEHKLRQSRDEALTCSQAGCSSRVRAACRARVAALNKAIPTIVFVVKDTMGRNLSDVEVDMDDETIAEFVDGTPISVDPGEHTFTFDAANHSPAEPQSFLIREGEKGRKVTIMLQVPPPPSRAVVAERTPPPTLAAPGISALSQRDPALRTFGVDLSIAGVAGLLAGGILEGLSISRSADSTSECSSSRCPQPAESSMDHSAAAHLRTASIGAVAAGGTLLVGGITLLIATPKRNDGSAEQPPLKVSPLLTPSARGVSFEGAF